MELGEEVGETLLRRGGDAILQEVYGKVAASPSSRERVACRIWWSRATRPRCCGPFSSYEIKPEIETTQTRWSALLVGRARHQASALSSGLRELGAEVLEIPFIEICRPRSYQALDEALKNLSQYDWLILTSVNGVEAVWERLRKLRLGGKSMRHLKIAAQPRYPAGHRAARDEGGRSAH